MKNCDRYAATIIMLALLGGCSDPASIGPKRGSLVDDVTPPAIVSVTLDPTTVDVTNAPQTLTARIHVTDDVSGVSYCTLYMRSPTSETQELAFSFNVASNLVQGTPLDAIMQAEATLPQFVEPGAWTMRLVICSDAVGLNTSYTAYNPPPFQAPILNVTSVMDATPPTILSITASQNSVDVTNSPQQITFTWHVTDDVSGVSYCMLIYSSPSHSNEIYPSAGYPYNAVGGDSHDVVLSGTATVPQNAEPGTWSVRLAYCEDAVHNTHLYYSADAMPVVPPAINVVSMQDTNPPLIGSVTVSPAVVDVSASSAPVTAQFSVSDDLTGISVCNLFLQSPSHQQEIDFMVQVPTHVIQGDQKNAVLERTITVPQYSETGLWTMRLLTCADSAQNSVAYTPANPPPFALPTLMIGLPSIHDLLVRLMDKVGELANDGSLQHGEANSLNAKLRAALELLDQDSTAARNQVNAFGNEVHALQRSHRLTTADADALVARAEEILRRLGPMRP